MEHSANTAGGRILGAVVVQGRRRQVAGLEYAVCQQQKKPQEVIPMFWQAFMERIDEIPGRLEKSCTIGLYLYEPPFGPGQDFRYMAGVEVAGDEAVPLPEGMVTRTIEEADCVVVTYRGKAEDFGIVWDWFHGEWFPQQSEYDAVDHFEFERHDERYLGGDQEESVFEMYFPVKRRAASSGSGLPSFQ
ncbi:GyrI-like domain-containing protein [Paenibacillus tarimensis]|uniref:GyrI-like domain-containing protein n=1 Tax=Paenibacillus tarimensis TaxID=416012 RepID=UPI001F24C6D4|nr:GyrI-like domain-containing protein [Paenibacillus tarimensis]MCF2944709.1 GyrI-like domain-containing protein [Paenibacillus tarimensis]